MTLERRRALADGRILAADVDLAVAAHFGCDPYAVDHVWPVGLRRRAWAWIQAHAEHAETTRRRR